VRKQEKDELEDSEHRREAKRMRTYSDAGDADGPRRRTRSMDKSEAAAVEAQSDMTPAEWRKEHSITIQGHGADRGKTAEDYPAPFQAFSEAPFTDRLQQALTGAGFTKPSAIQAQAWPLALKGMDLISIAKTGSGKTCGFLLPAFHQHLQKTERRQGRCQPVLLVLAPTRELSVQIMEEAQKFGRAVGIRSIVSTVSLRVVSSRARLSCVLCVCTVEDPFSHPCFFFLFFLLFSYSLILVCSSSSLDTIIVLLRWSLQMAPDRGSGTWCGMHHCHPRPSQRLD
jgi:hypothetical protein